MQIKEIFRRVKTWLASLSFRTGMIVLGACVVCYVISFAQALLPISIAWKGALWVIFFGLAKTFQYSGILIIGKEGWKRLKTKYFKKKIETI